MESQVTDDEPTDLKTLLERFAALAPAPGMMPAHAFIAEHGVDFVPAKLPKGMRRGEPKNCYFNAYRLSQETGLDYVEGFALRPSIGFPLEHAWCVDGTTVVDHTWDTPDICLYRGVIIPDVLLAHELVRIGHYGVLHSVRGTNLRLIKALTEAAKETA